MADESYHKALLIFVRRLIRFSSLAVSLSRLSPAYPQSRSCLPN